MGLNRPLNVLQALGNAEVVVTVHCLWILNSLHAGIASPESGLLPNQGGKNFRKIRENERSFESAIISIKSGSPIVYTKSKTWSHIQLSAIIAKFSSFV